MSGKTIEERIVEMRFDNAQFERGVSQTMSSVERLKRGLDLSGAAKGFETLDWAVGNVQRGFSALEVMGVTALANITNSAVNAGKRIVKALSIDPIKSGFEEYETQINAVQTILANTSSKGTTLEQVNAALDELNHYADMTIYNFTEMTRNIGTFTAAGVDLDTSVSAIKGIANLAAVSGSTSQQASTAMYQLSQALAAGTVKLMDWNSVVNAGMGGQVFQDALKDTARIHGIAIDQMIKDEGSFRETLQKGWLSSDILTETLQKFTGDLTKAQLLEQGYTEEQTAAILEMGQTANDAATKVKTFTQLIDTLKEAAQSGWTESWETIVGDFEEAKGLWTRISDVLGKMIGDSANARNELLSGALDSDWTRFLGEGITDAVAFKESILEAAKAHGVAIEELASNTGSFEESLNQGWLTADILSEALENLSGKTSGLSDAELASLGVTREQADALEELNRSAKNGTVDLEEYANQIGRLSGRDNLLASFWNTWDALFAVPEEAGDLAGAFTVIKEAFREIFPAATSEQLYRITENLKQFTESFKMSGETAENLKNTFKGAFAVLDIGKQALTSLAKAISPLFGGFVDLGGGILGVTGRFDEWLVSIDDAIKKSGKLNAAAEKIADFVADVTVAIKGFGGSLRGKINFSGMEALHGILGRVQTRIGQIGDAADGMGSIFSTACKSMSAALENSDIFRLLGTRWNGVKTFGAGVSEALGALGTGLIDKLGNANFSGILDLLSGLSLSGIALSVSKFLKGVTEPLGGIQDILDGVRGSLEAFQTQLKAGTLMKIAAAMGVLTGAIVALSLVDSAKLNVSLGAMTVMFAELMASMAILDKIGGSSSALKKTSVEMIAMATAVFILAGAVNKMAELDWESLAKGLVGTGALLTEIGAFLSLAKFDGKITKTATGMLVLSAAIKVLASACKDFGGMDWSQIGKGLTGIGALLAEFVLFTNLTGNAKHVASTGLAMIEIAAAMKIFASAVGNFGSLSLEQIGTGLLAMAGTLAEVAIAANLMPKNLAGVGVGLIAVGGALEIIANVLGKLGGFTWEQAATGLVTLGGALVELAIGLNLMKGTLGGAAAMLTAAGALAVMTPVLSILGAMSWEGIAKGIISIAGAFTVIGVAGAVLTPLVPAILSLAGSFALIGAGVLGVGAGLLAAGAGLSALAVGLTALAVAGASGATAIVSALSVIILGVAGLIPAVMTKIGEGIVAFCNVISSSAPAIGEAIKAVILTTVSVFTECAPAVADGLLALITAALSSLAEYTPQIADSLLKILTGILESLASNLPTLIPAAVNAIAAFFEGVFNAIGGMDIATLAKAIAGVGLLSVMMVALGTLAGLVPNAMAGVLGMGAVIAEIALVLAAIGALAQIPGLNWLIGEGGSLLEGLGTAIGSFVGGIVGGVMSGISSQFPQIGADLAAFMTNLQPFIEGASRIDAGSMEGIRSLAETILALTGADILQGIASWLTGGSSMSKFAEQLVPFGEAMAAYSKAVSGSVNPEAVTASANAASVLAELAHNLPNSGGLVSWVTGDNNIAAFGENLADFGAQLEIYYESVSGIDGAKLSAVTSSLESLIGIARDTQTLDTWGLREFGASLTAMGDIGVDGFVSAFSDAEQTVKESGKSLVVNLESGVRQAISNFRKVGQDAAQGFINGITSKIGAVSAAGQSLGNTAVAATRKALDSHSPSEEEYAVGQDAGEGLALGISSTGKRVSDAATTVATGVVKATQTALDSVNLDSWIGKTTKAGETETKVCQETAKEAEKSAATKSKSYAKTEKAAKSAYETFLEYIEEERYYNRLSTEEELEQYRKVQAAYKLSAEERKKVAREVYRLENELKEEAYQHSMDWIEQEKYYNRLSLEEELAAYERVQARHKEGTEEWKKLEREKYRVQNELAKAAYENSLNWIEQEKYYNRLSLEEELAAWERVQARYLQGTEERKKAAREIYRVQNELAEQEYENSMSWIEEEEAYDRLGMAAKLAAYTRVQQRYEKGTEKRKKLDREVYNLQKQLWQAQKDYYADVEKVQSDYHQKRMDLEDEYAEKVKSVNEQLERDIQSANDAYQNALESRADSLYKAYGLFDEVTEKDEVDGSVLMKNLEDQVKEFGQWQDTLDNLSGRGLSEEMVEELREMGPSAIAQIKALNAMSDSELEKYAALWSIKHAMAREEAVSELEDLRIETQNKIATLRAESAQELEEYRAMWSQQMSELESTTAKQLEDLKNEFEKTVGILPEYTEEEFSEMVETANEILGKAGWTELGQSIVTGLSKGISSEKDNFIQELTDLANAGVNAVKDTLDIHSPSKVFAELGNFAALGFVNGLSNHSGRSYEAGVSLAEGARDGLAFAANVMSDVLEHDPEPVIRPVLDLSDVEAGANRLDTLLAREQVLQIQNAYSSGNRGSELAALTDTLRSGFASGNRDVVDAIGELRADVSTLADAISRMQVVLDSQTLVGELSPAIDRELGTLANWRGRNM